MNVIEQIRKGYERITGRPVEITVCAVRQDSFIGWWFVHPIPSGDFYMVNVKKCEADRGRQGDAK